MTMLKDMRGGREFIKSLVSSAAGMAIAFVGEPDEDVRAHLAETLGKDLPIKLARHLGTENAAAITEALIRATLGRKRELERN